MTTVCRCPDMKFDVNGSVVPLPQGTDPDCPSCYPDARAALAQQCTAERPFGPCTQRCDQPAGPLFWCSGCHKNSCPTCVMACCEVVPAYVLPVALVEQIAAREQESRRRRD